jgi:hypothetical protein
MSEFFQNFEPVSYSLQTKERDLQLVFSVYNGTPQITIWGNKQKQLGARIGICTIAVLSNKLKTILKAAPGTKLPYVLKEWDRDNKKFKIQCVITVMKLEDKSIAIQVSFQGPQGNMSGTFLVKPDKVVAISTDNVSREDESAMGVTTLTYFFDNVFPAVLVLTKRKYIPKNGGGNNNNAGKSSSSDDSFF